MAQKLRNNSEYKLKSNLTLQQISIETLKAPRIIPRYYFSYNKAEDVNFSAYTHLMMIIHISLSLKARSIHGNNKRSFYIEIYLDDRQFIFI